MTNLISVSLPSSFVKNSIDRFISEAKATDSPTLVKHWIDWCVITYGISKDTGVSDVYNSFMFDSESAAIQFKLLNSDQL